MEIQDVIIPWWASGQDSAVPLQGAQVPSLVRELRFHKAFSAANKEKNLTSTEKGIFQRISELCKYIPFDLTIHFQESTIKIHQEKKKKKKKEVDKEFIKVLFVITRTGNNPNVR